MPESGRPVRPLATPEEVAEYLGVSTQALAQMRWLGTGPVFTRVTPRTIRYRWADIEAYELANRRNRTDQVTAPAGTSA